MVPVIAGAALGMMSNEIGRQNQKKDNAEYGVQQVKNSKELARYNQQLGLETWEKTNYEAQRRQMEKAGLNIGLMYEGGGAGGGTVATPSGSAGMPSANNTGMGISEGTAMGAQLELLKAQKENIEADTKNKLAGEGDTQSSKELKDIEIDVNRKTAEDRIKGTISEEVKKVNDALISTNITNDEIKRIKAEAINAVLQTKLTEAQIKETEGKITKMLNDTDQKTRELDIAEFKAELEAKYPSMDKVKGGMTNQIIRTIEDILGLERGNYEKVKK